MDMSIDNDEKFHRPELKRIRLILFDVVVWWDGEEVVIVFG